MRIAGLVADGTGRRYGNWWHVATGSNALVWYRKQGLQHPHHCIKS